ncbi:hypothetical protein G6F24_017111 [Rhizopus arrhizus]|nr:hypothetical protein G6F24_017111 [Rhizopus arrhizus]
MSSNPVPSNEHRASLPARYAGLRAGSVVLPGLQQAARAAGAGHQRGQRRARAGYALRAGPGAGRLQPRRDGALAGFQRHRLAAEWGHPSDNLGPASRAADPA